MTIQETLGPLDHDPYQHDGEQALREYNALLASHAGEVTVKQPNRELRRFSPHQAEELREWGIEIPADRILPAR